MRARHSTEARLVSLDGGVARDPRGTPAQSGHRARPRARGPGAAHAAAVNSEPLAEEPYRKIEKREAPPVEPEQRREESRDDDRLERGKLASALALGAHEERLYVA